MGATPTPCAPARESLYKRTGSCLTSTEKRQASDNVRQAALRPERPSTWKHNPRQWLSTTEIDAVMQQYQEKYKSFVYFGAHPRDFGLRGAQASCVPGAPIQLCSFDLERFLASGKREFGVVFNLDTRWQRGSHWVAVYADFNPKHRKFGACYFDSGGVPAPFDDIGRFLHSLQNQARRLKMDGFSVQENAVEVQKKNTECGVYVMKFIIRCLEERRRSYQATIGDLGDDDEVWRFRKILFRK